MKYFSLIHKLHFFEFGEYGLHCDRIFQLIVCGTLLSFRVQMCWLSLVELLLFLLLNDALCCVYLVLKVFSYKAMYVSSLPVWLFVTVAWYTMDLVRHLFSIGHCSGILQWQPVFVVTLVLVLAITVLLWFVIICLMFAMQL